MSWIDRVCKKVNLMKTAKLARISPFKVRLWKTIFALYFPVVFLLHLAEDSALISQHRLNAEQISVSVLLCRRNTQLWKCPNFYLTEKLCWRVNYLKPIYSRAVLVHRNPVSLCICRETCMSRRKRSIDPLSICFSAWNTLLRKMNLAVIFKAKSRIFNLVRDLAVCNTAFALSLSSVTALCKR